MNRLYGVFVCLYFGALGRAQSLYHIQDLGVVPGYRFSYATGVNDIGDAVGTSFQGPTSRQAFRNVGHGPKGLGFPQNSENPTGGKINNDGEICGQYTDRALIESRPFRWSEGLGYQALARTSGYTPGTAIDINASGTILGSNKRLSDGQTEMIFWNRDGTSVQVGPPNGTRGVLLFSMNDLGQVGCASTTEETRLFPYLWDPTSGYRELGLMQGLDAGRSVGVNNHSTVAIRGVSNLGDSWTYLWTASGGHERLFSDDMVGLQAEAINDNDVVVGAGAINGTHDIRAFVWNRQNTHTRLDSMLDAASQGWTLEWAYDVNNRGQIVGTGIINGVEHGYLATPVPEPGSLAVLGGSLIALLRNRRRRSART
ncbi:MAG: PEP-CTERM sorting domain-containing protein [Chthonomonadaceae bacterium]|nr:PEP-CTERM sorting domain-containing protein [Chthonomonadaceae bacterium]